MLEIHHFDLIERLPGPSKEFLKALKDDAEVTLHHRPDGSCCRKEPWPDTLKFFTDQLPDQEHTIQEVNSFPVNFKGCDYDPYDPAPEPEGILKFDHLKLVRRDPEELGRLLAALRGAARSGTLLVSETYHESDDSCCREEPWEETQKFALSHFPGHVVVTEDRNEGYDPARPPTPPSGGAGPGRDVVLAVGDRISIDPTVCSTTEDFKAVADDLKARAGECVYRGDQLKTLLSGADNHTLRDDDGVIHVSGYDPNSPLARHTRFVTARGAVQSLISITFLVTEHPEGRIEQLVLLKLPHKPIPDDIVAAFVAFFWDVRDETVRNQLHRSNAMPPYAALVGRLIPKEETE